MKNRSGWRLSRAQSAPSVTVQSFPGSTVEDMESYCLSTVRAQPDEIILHVGTNDLQTGPPRQVADSIINLVDNISQNCSCRLTISSLLKRFDKANLNNKVTEVNSILRKFSTNRGWMFISHDGINQAANFNSSGLHLSHSGNSLFVSNLIINKHFNSSASH